LALHQFSHLTPLDNFMDVYKHVLHNGKLITRENATIPIFSPAMTGVFGVYESILLRNGHYVAAAEHAHRLLQSIKGAQLSTDLTLDRLFGWLLLLASVQKTFHAVVRVLVLDLGNRYADVYLYSKRYKPPSVSAYKNGVPVILYRGERAMPQIKSLNTLVPGLARKAAKAAGVHDALLVNRLGQITEGTTCNVFAVQDGVLLAPPAEDVLAGTVMEQVLRLAREMGIPTRRQVLAVDAVLQWQEAFLTSTQRGVLPIKRIDDLKLGPPGSITRQLHQAYRHWEDALVGLG
jgi:branched-subunit amino acid aminotransferase/4-amino-4-deoxychorismate lyase